MPHISAAVTVNETSAGFGEETGKSQHVAYCQEGADCNLGGQ